MPDPKLEQLMLNRPLNVTGEVPYPTTQADKGPVKNFLGAAIGVDDQQPGDLGSALGTVAGMTLPLGMNPKLGSLGEDEQLMRSLFDRAIEQGVAKSTNRADRNASKMLVDRAYNKLADRGLAAMPDELSKVRVTLDQLKNSSLKAAPTGLETGKHNVAIINKLAGVGYTPTEADSNLISELLQQAAMQTGRFARKIGTGEYAAFVKRQLPLGHPLRRALASVPSWADGQTIRQIKK